MMSQKEFENITRKHQSAFYPVVQFDPQTDKLLQLDFTENNKALTAEIVEDVNKFSGLIDCQLQIANCKFGIGGYAEHRTVYSRSRVFDAAIPGEEPRRLHLGVDIWGQPGTPVYAFMESEVHSFAFNDHYGDYGATLILSHKLDELLFHTLYGHICLTDISGIKEGQKILAGQEIAHFGEPHENGHWPPHLHFQVTLDMESKKGDYPGVCKYSEREKYLANCPDPDLILQLNRYV